MEYKTDSKYCSRPVHLKAGPCSIPLWISLHSPLSHSHSPPRVENVNKIWTPETVKSTHLVILYSISYISLPSLSSLLAKPLILLDPPCFTDPFPTRFLDTRTSTPTRYTTPPVPYATCLFHVFVVSFPPISRYPTMPLTLTSMFTWFSLDFYSFHHPTRTDSLTCGYVLY